MVVSSHFAPGVRVPCSCTRECSLACLGRGVWGAQLLSKPELVSRIHPSLCPAVHHPFPPRPTAGDQASQGTRDANIYTRVPGRSRHLVLIFPILLPMNGSAVAPGLAGCMLRSLPWSLHRPPSGLLPAHLPHAPQGPCLPVPRTGPEGPLSSFPENVWSSFARDQSLTSGTHFLFCPRPDDTHSFPEMRLLAVLLFRHVAV